MSLISLTLPLLLLGALTMQAGEPYRCSVPITVQGLSGGMWRDFGFGVPDDYYKIQLQNPAIESSPFALWLIDNRPPAPPRRYGYDFGSPEAVVFRQGPDSVNFGTIVHGEVPDGQIWARLFGDGAYAGTFMVQTSRQTRRAHRAGARGLWMSVHQRGHPEIVARLAEAATWEAVLVDGTGRELGRRSVRVPTGTQMEVIFQASRAQLLREREAFLAAGGQGDDESAPCAIFGPPEI